MNTLAKYAVLAGFAVLLLVLAPYKLSRTSVDGGPAQRVPQPTAQQAPQTPPPDAAPTVVAQAPSAAPEALETIAPLPPNATSVPDEDLLKLSGMVELGSAQYDRPDKARWSQALPIASKLLHGPCDCEQRNWLNHFVGLGNEALSDANGQYYQDAKIMATLGRNDNDAMARSRH